MFLKMSEVLNAVTYPKPARVKKEVDAFFEHVREKTNEVQPSEITDTFIDNFATASGKGWTLKGGCASNCWPHRNGATAQHNGEATVCFEALWIGIGAINNNENRWKIR